MKDMTLIDRYIEEVTDQLPDKERAGVALALGTKIQALLPSPSSQADVLILLESLGDPTLMADSYRTDQRYLIGPRYYPQYLYVMRMTLVIVIAIMAAVTSLEWLVKPPTGGFLDFFHHLSFGLFSAVLHSVTWITFIFFLIDRTNLAHGRPKKKTEAAWSPQELMTDRAKGKTIPRNDPLISMALNAILISLLYFKPELIGFYSQAKNGNWVLLPVFDPYFINHFLPFIVLVAALTFFLSSWKLLARRWTFAMALTNLVQNLVSMLLTTFMFWKGRVLNPELAPIIANYTPYTVSQVQSALLAVSWIIIGIITVTALWDSLSPLIQNRQLIPGRR